MLEPAEILALTAEIAVGIAGFSGVVIVLGKGNSWTAQEQLSIWAILQASLGALVLSLFPIVLSQFLSESLVAWRVSVAALAAYHLVIFAADMYRIYSVTGVVTPLLLFIPGVLISVSTTALLTAIAMGFFSSLIYAGYLLGVFWLLCISVLWFVSIIRITISRGT